MVNVVLGMAADIDSQHLLLKGKDHVLGILSHVRKFYLVFLFLILGYNVKKAELPGHVVLLIVGDLIHNLHIGAHELLSRPRKAVKGSGLDKVFDSLLVYLLVRHPRDEILEIGNSPLALRSLTTASMTGFPMLLMAVSP